MGLIFKNLRMSRLQVGLNPPVIGSAFGGGIFDMQNITGTAYNNGGWGNFGADFKNSNKGLRCIRKVVAA